MLPDLNGDFIQWLRGFYYTVECGSIMGATSAMHRNQSAITYQIQSLESLYGVELFTNTKGGKRGLTPEGKFLYAKAVELFAEIDGIRTAIGQAHDDVAGEIKIAASNSLLEHFLAESIRTFMERYPRASFILEGVSDIRTSLQMLTSRQVDFSVGHLDAVHSNFVTMELFSSDISLVSPKEGPYAFKAFDPGKLPGVPYIAPPVGSSLEVHLRGQFLAHGLEMQNEILSAPTGGVKEFAAMGLGVAFLRDFSLYAADYERFNIISMKQLFKPMRYGIIQRRSVAMSFLCEEFIKHFKTMVNSDSEDRERKAGGA